MNIENQTSLGTQNNQNIRQNSNTSQPTLEKSKAIYLLLGVNILICLFVLGIAVYYLGSRQVFQKNKSPETSPTLAATTGTPPVTTPANEPNVNANLNTYKDAQYSFAFDYPEEYLISPNPDCSGLINNQADCLSSLILNPTNSDYPPKAYFWLLKGINSVNIPGQVNNISFDTQRRVWVLNTPFSSPNVLSVWAYTKSGQEIIRSSNGGSHGSSYYFIIPNYQKDQVAIFSIPQSYRLRCDYFIKDKSKETDCNNFYKSIINQYNKGQPTVDMWLPENYLSSIYSEAENIVKSYREETTK